MTALRVYEIACDGGCGAGLRWATGKGERPVTVRAAEQRARNKGWNAPDKLGRHWCPGCRRTPARKASAARSAGTTT